jgi:hypothetical protein
MTAGSHIRRDYDGDGNRVEKSNGKIYWYGAELKSSTSPT